jgi:hypothetical protein
MLSPYPLELVPFEPVDGPDSRFGQLNKPIGKAPYYEAGIKGFEPATPFKMPANFSTVPSTDDFYWPCLSELNDEICPYPWLPGEKDAFDRELSTVQDVPAMYTGPPPAPPVSSPPSIPDIASLAAKIIASADRLFFVAIGPVSSSYREWRLVRIAFDDSIALHPACLQDGKFLVEFYVCHHDDVRFNATNQRYWLQYHLQGDLVSPMDTTTTHIVRPSDTSHSLALRKGLLPFQQWVNLTHESVYLHGPFDFATLNGRKTRDRISHHDWAILRGYNNLYGNAPPDLELPTYSVHVDRGVFSSFHSPNICALLQLAALQAQTTGDTVYR